MTTSMTTTTDGDDVKVAVTSVPVHPLLAGRWSPRGFDPMHQLDEEALTALLEAARWAPSAKNSQPWRFLCGRRGDRTFAALCDVLLPGNSVWARHASALVLVATRTHDDAGQSLRWGTYDTGQAAACLVLQATAAGLHTHQMGGFEASRALQVFDLQGLDPMVVIAIGRRDPRAALPDELAAREHAPRDRYALPDLLLTWNRA